MTRHVMFKKRRCEFCGREMKHFGKFCSECIPERLELSGAIDLKDNHTIKDLGNGYIQIIPIDETKKITAKSFRERR